MSASPTDSKTRKGLVWIIGGVGAALIAAMLIVKIWFATTVFMLIDEAAVAAASEPLDPEELVVREMVTPVSPGTPVMPTATPALDPSDYSRDLARFIPIEVGMDRYLAKDELLLHYNSEPISENPEARAKVSSNEQIIDGATLFVIRRSGMADDSVAAEETFALFNGDVLVDFGSRIQCRRGDAPHQWTTNLCP
ncbi:MAG: hypothetical protein ACSHX3_04375 [Litorimonas sp.]